MEKAIEEYRKYKAPFSAAIELLSSCNWKCVHCYLENHVGKGMKYADVISLLRKMRRFGIYEVDDYICGSMQTSFLVDYIRKFMLL